MLSVWLCYGQRGACGSDILCLFCNDAATTEIYTLHIVGSVRCVQETDIIQKVKKQNRSRLIPSIPELIGMARTNAIKLVLREFIYIGQLLTLSKSCLLYTSPSPRDQA
eukprot:TRINITY_DN36056_c0_g1_i1.p2 TRINITY_DN36056_c0_g1~~TRINITY_DN36056_c0_g1_i1.p2  ORF type:complete len:109 (+),score=11.70 TRINITY_DN36056_c0_g1_i1:3-329(+)